LRERETKKKKGHIIPQARSSEEEEKKMCLPIYDATQLQFQYK
jgi:hypothetical protein